jgi:hypothetical protein
MQTTDKLTVPGLPASVRAYLTTALWSSVDDEGEPFDRNYSLSDFSQSALARAVACVGNFERENDEALSAAIATGEVVRGPDFNEWERAGHDLWLTRNGHGAGFWDGDWPKPYADVLTMNARNLGEVEIYVSQTGEVEMA